MAYPLPVTPQPLVPPASRPLLAVGLLPALAGRYHAYLPLGSIAGDVLTYRDLAGFGWWTPVNLFAATQANVSEDAGSIFEAVAAIAIDASISEAYPWGTPIESGDPLLMVEAFTPEQPSFQYYAVRTRNSDLRVTTTGETIMGRLARTIPPRLMDRVADITLADTMTAQEAIQYILDQWTAEYDWFAAEPTPDLRLLVDEAIGNERQYYVDNPDAGLITTGAIVIPQETEGDRDERRTMREIIDEWLAIFPGTVIRANSEGRVAIVPRVGPDLPETPVRTLTWRDIKAISEGENDPRGITNQARVVNQGWEFRGEQALLAPQFTVVTFPSGLDRGVLESENVLPATEELQPYQPVTFTGLTILEDPVEFTVEIRAYGSWNRTTSSQFSLEGQTSDTFTLESGESRLVTLVHSTRGWTVRFQVRLERTVDGALLATPGPDDFVGYRESIAGRTYLAYVVDITDATGTAWVKAARSISASFGYKTDDWIPAPDGSNAIQNSIATFGERPATINSTIFQLTPAQAAQVARAYVLTNINPRTIRDVEQSLWDRYPVRFDDVGQRVQLPSGEVGIVEHRDYADASTASSFMVTSRFSAAIIHSVIDTETDWLLSNSGDYLLLDDGAPTEGA